ncbi:hypothetical protein [Kutzneria sp. CA-103260]|uniref:hypothetical protein n=1 Tax=Kutzneria sp. CA-103260 TaxID=2802641 RepID=UPI001BA65336|nr:hypothetical protein [Kutzneria sp. CA-103260]
MRIVTKLPDFQVAAFGEILARLTELRDNPVETLARVDEIAEITRATAANASLAELLQRLRLLPVIDREAFVQRWHNAKAAVWAIVVALTNPEEEPDQLLGQWQADPPAWLVSAPLDARIVAAELAIAYSANRLAADLFAAVAADGAPRRQF